MLKVLDRCMAVNTQACELENSLAESACAIGHSRQSMTGYRHDTNPDWFLPVTGNPRISEVFCRYLDSLSLDNNPLVTSRVERVCSTIWNLHICSRYGEWKDVPYC